eukprot:TRINITY_DN8929_c0_g1_i4.p1 TRINITY_DN8929_c0_g1~~TRINITY_DN8929_c0_g1_i4.p1  ORF type:complete len:204 (+),score=48.36 TRINITY_DN8929_c0_g1_i4:14-625(+)
MALPADIDVLLAKLETDKNKGTIQALRTAIAKHVKSNGKPPPPPSLPNDDIGTSLLKIDGATVTSSLMRGKCCIELSDTAMSIETAKAKVTVRYAQLSTILASKVFRKDEAQFYLALNAPINNCSFLILKMSMSKKHASKVTLQQPQPLLKGLPPAAAFKSILLKHGTQQSPLVLTCCLCVGQISPTQAVYPSKQAIEGHELT